MVISSPLLNLFIDLVKIDALSHSEKPVADYIKRWLLPIGFKIVEDEAGKLNNGNSGNLICTYGDGGNTAYLAHMDTARPTKDVVPIINEDRITTNGNTVLGVDNRAGIAILLSAAKELIRNENNQHLTLIFTIDEETGLSGSTFLDIPDKIKTGIVFDSALRPGSIICQSYGAQRLEIEILGKASHSGLAPEKGINAIQLAAKALSGLKLGRINEITTANIGLFAGGSAINVVPDYVKMEGEVRSMTAAGVERQIQIIMDHIKKIISEENGKVKFKTKWDFVPYDIPENGELFLRIAHQMEALGLKPHKAISAGGSDANALNSKGIPTVNLGIGAQNPHSESEYILIKDIEIMTDLAIKLMSDNNM